MNCKNSQVVTIKKVVNGGYGLAVHSDGKTVFVHQALPGETVRITAIKRQHRLEYARIVEIVNGHPGRFTPPCPHYAKCGGCNLQHADYPTQCGVKQQIITDLLARSHSPFLAEQADSIADIVPAPLPFGYRQRIRLHVDPQGRAGFHRFHSREIVPIRSCLLAHPVINKFLTAARKMAVFQQLAANSEHIEFLLNPVDRTLCLLFGLQRPPRPTDRKAARRLCDEKKQVGRVLLACRQGATEGPFTADDRPADRLLTMELAGTPPLKMSWEAGGFSQVNLEQNQALIALVVRLAQANGSDRILELFCGMGNFSLPVARQSGRLLGIENQGSAIRSARLNSKQNNQTNVTFEQADVTAACARLIAGGQRFETIICDPPRQGMPGLAPLLDRLAIRRLVYVSCDPATLCRDLAELIDEGFFLKAAYPVDMFPQTHHIETVALLEKN